MAARLSEINEHWKRKDKAIELAERAQALLPSVPETDMFGAVNLAPSRSGSTFSSISNTMRIL